VPYSCEAYLDIETTGLSPYDNEITIIGIHRSSNIDDNFIQLVGDDISAYNIMDALDSVGTIYTYNGSRFDLPFINSRMGINLPQIYNHCDLMYKCWRHNLYGGLKIVEKKLGISRRLTDINGYEAIRLWWDYVNNYDETALKTLLEYNKEDVLNLRALKEKLL